MIRDPRDRYHASIERWPKGRGRAGGAVARWQYSTRLAERHVKRHPDQYLIVRFEDLIERTESTLCSVCDFLGEEFRPAMLTMDGAPKHRDRISDGRKSTSPSELMSTDHIGRYRGRISSRDLAFIQLHAGRRMES